MSNSLIRILIAVVLIAHGIGHTSGLFPVFGWAKSEVWTGRSWVLDPVLGESLSRWLGVLIWLLATLGFISAGLGLLGYIVPQSSWRVLALASSVISLVGILLYWNGFPNLGSKASALVVDVATLIALLWARWPTPEIAGA